MNETNHNATVIDEGSNSVYYASNFTSFAFIVLVGVVIYFWRRYQRKSKEQKLLTKKEVTKFLEGCSDDEEDDSLPYSGMAYNKSFEIEIGKLQMDEGDILGVGEYGMVYKGMYNSTPVAVKTLKPNANLMYFKSLLSELKIMIFIGSHENIVQCVGAHTGKIRLRKLLVIVEYCKHGSLESFLRGNREAFGASNYQNLRKIDRVTQDWISKRDLLIWSVQICNGMKYLAEKKVVHGDLASRNILLDQAKTVKITDFGLSRQIFNCSNYVKTSSKETPLPWRWLAIETMRALNFSTKSDVWSFGITLWEIFSLAQIPYPGLNYSHQFIKMLEDGLRMTRPTLCTEDIYILMLECWRKIPNERPDFIQLHEKLNLLL